VVGAAASQPRLEDAPASAAHYQESKPLDAFMHAWTVTDPDGITAKYVYSKDGYNGLTDKIVAGGTGPRKFSHETQYSYTNYLLTSNVRGCLSTVFLASDAS
jgi:hypothetical protein